MIILPSKVKTEEKFIPILLDSIRIDSILNFDLFISIDGNLILYRSADLAFTEKTRSKLLDNRVDKLYISSENKKDYQRYIEKNLNIILHDPKILEEKKAGILYETSTSLVKDILENPTLGENIERSKDLVENTLNFILKGRETFISLMSITTFDFYTYTHSVNVCTFSIALAQQVGFKDEEFLHELGVGALLHDIGKSKVSDRILNKRSQLNQIEFEIMKKHPKWGIDILSETNLISASSYYPVLQHHERADRSGYPNGLALDEMHLYSKIVAIADTFDALTSERVYQKAMDSFPALKLMMAQKDLFDEKILMSFVELMGPDGLKNI